MGESAMTKTVLRKPIKQQPESSVMLWGIAGHVTAMLACGLLTALAIPFAPEAWLGWAASLLVATGLLSVRRTQPGIDDREVDWILATLGLCAGVWVLRQWPGSGQVVPDTAAWLLCTTACLLIVSGTRAMSWVWPAAPPALFWLLPAPLGPLLTLGWVILAGVAIFVVMARRGLAPVDQLIRLPKSRLMQVAVALVVVAIAARLGVAA